MKLLVECQLYKIIVSKFVGDEKCPKKDYYRGKSCWPHPRKSGPEVFKDQVE